MDSGVDTQPIHRFVTSRVRYAQWTLIAIAGLAFHLCALGDPVPVHYPEGTVHGFLSMTDSDGKVLASGDLIQVLRGDRVTSHLVYRFKDGSVDDETAIFTQRGNFKLMSDHHIQKGPFFPHPLDVLIDAAHGQVTVKSVNKDGVEEVNTTHMSLPSDIYNGLVGSIVKNVQPAASVTRVSMLVFTPKPRLVKLAISPFDEDSFTVAGVERKARKYQVKIELGGLAGVVAPLVGKAPPEINLWVVSGEVPVVVRDEAPLSDGTPIVNVWLASPVWPKSSIAAN